MAGQDCVYELRNHRVVVADDSGKELLTGLKFSHQVLSELVSHGTTLVARGFEFSERWRVGT